MAKYAVADIGTNSVRLMLADETLCPVEKRLITTRIGEKLSETGALSEAGMARTLNALCGYADAAAEFGAPFGPLPPAPSGMRTTGLNSCGGRWPWASPSK